MAKAKAKSTRRRLGPVFIREWRKHRGLTLEAMAERIEGLTGQGITYATLSRIERSKIAYTQPVLEAVADALSCRPADLIMRPPTAADRIQAIFEDMSPDTQKRALAIVQALKDSEAA